MKLELPFAILLLAAGGWLWMSHYPSELFQPHKEVAAHSEQPNVAIDEAIPEFQSLPIPDSIPTDQNFVQLSNFNQPRRTATSPFGNFEPGTNDPGMLLAQAAKQMELSPPIACKARCQINLFDQVIVGEGSYYQRGQGSGLTHLKVNFPISEQSELQSTQICDGKFYYWIQNLDGERTIEFIDLNELQSDKFDLSSGPVQWLTRTGTVSLLRNLSAAFEFEAPTKTNMGGHEMLVLKGKWKPDAIQSLLYGQFNADSKEPIRWDRLPNQLPHAVEVYLGTDDFLHLFPYRLSFFQFDGEQRKPDPMMTMELFEVQKVDSVPGDLFRVDANGSQQFDLSRDYSKHLEQMAEAAADTLKR